MGERADPRKSLPRGTVTLLFADVEGSTRLLDTLGAGYGAVRARLRDLVRQIASARGGVEVDWAGDGVFLAFTTAGEAVAAAVDLQRALAAEPWPHPQGIRLRIGVHTGEPDPVDEGYVGMDVHLAARICGAAHGGQVVVSASARETAPTVPEIAFRSLGRHRLKDVPGSTHLFQALAPGLDDLFPPLRTLTGATLPALHHRLVGRDDALSRIDRLLHGDGVRLVTIAGAGGAGKSRLALEVAAAAARERPVHVVGLASLSSPEHVPAAIARTVGAREAPGRPLLPEIAEALAGTQALLLLDNFEHVAAAATDVAALLESVPGLQVLTTSRVPLRLSAEWVVRLDPLAVEDATTLLVELATARGVAVHERDLPTAAEICGRLDGLPLAIELVAARLATLSPAEILRALDNGLALQMEGPVDLPDRQRTLRATIEWSYGLLTPAQQDVLGALAVFAGGCTFEDAREVAGAPAGFLPHLEALVESSLVRRDTVDGEARFSMLETVREDALARLGAQGSLAEVRARHARRFLALAATAEAELAGPGHAECARRLETELDNLRAALDWCLGRGRAEDALRALASLERYWRAGRVGEARRWLTAALALAHDVSADVRADALWTAAQQATAQYDWEAAVPLLEEALALFRSSGRGREAVFALSDLGFVAVVQEDLPRAATLCAEALAAARELADDRAVSAALNGLGEVLSLQGEHERALAHYEEAVALRRAMGDPLLVADGMYNLGVAAFRAGDAGRARAACVESLGLARGIGATPHIAAAQFMLAEIDLLGGDPRAARAAIDESLALYAELDNDRARAGCFVVLAGIAIATERFEEAAQLEAQADTLRGGAPLNPFELTVLERFQPDLEAALAERGRPSQETSAVVSAGAEE